MARNDPQYTVTDKGAKSVVLKTAGHDKLNPYIVFPGHKSEVQNLKKDPAIKNRCYVKSIINGWMNENATIDWVENVFKNFTFGKSRLFA